MKSPYIFQEYVPTSPSMLVSSLMRLISMLMHEACQNPEAAENRHLRTWLTVWMIFFYWLYFHVQFVITGMQHTQSVSFCPLKLTRAYSSVRSFACLLMLFSTSFCSLTSWNNALSIKGNFCNWWSLQLSIVHAVHSVLYLIHCINQHSFWNWEHNAKVYHLLIQFLEFRAFVSGNNQRDIMYLIKKYCVLQFRNH